VLKIRAVRTQKLPHPDGIMQTNSAKLPSQDSPRVIALPPVLYIGTLMVGLLAHFLWPVRPLAPFPTRILGGVLVLVSGGLGTWGVSTMRRAGTNVRPDKPTTVIVSDGPFRFTRNPLYLAGTGLYLGITLLVDAVWPLVLLAPLLAIIQWGVIKREERYLESKFGETYRAYKARVRRWL
jgi:protein-S-isoprenylcysteine O-methyltransferase Ste14